jgi:hypothetical protein
MGIIAALVLPVHCYGQEYDPKDPAVIADALSRADVVVIGTFHWATHFLGLMAGIAGAHFEFRLCSTGT